jgi:CRISPR-associated protein Csm5
MAKKQFTITITPLTGVHIGTGEELTPLDYKIAPKVGDVDFKKPMYWKFSSDRILQRLMGDEKALAAFENASVAGNMKELQNFFQKHCTEKSDTDYPCEATRKFLKIYNANMDKDPYQNAAKVLQMYRTEGSPRPVIPGSSLKGSIRTALLNDFLSGLSDKDYESFHSALKDERKPEWYNETLQKKLLDYSDAKNDPMRAVSISDCFFKATGTQLVGGLGIVAFDKQAEGLKAIGTQIQAEVIKGALLGGETSSELQLSIDTDLQVMLFPAHKRSIKSISLEDIRNACNNFYWDEFQTEYETHYQHVIDGNEKQILELKKRLEEAKNAAGQFIIRVGRWSQVEFVTFDKNFRRPIVTKKDKNGKPLGWGGTRTLFDFDGKYVPMGWCVLSVKE